MFCQTIQKRQTFAQLTKLEPLFSNKLAIHLVFVWMHERGHEPAGK